MATTQEIKELATKAYKEMGLRPESETFVSRNYKKRGPCGCVLGAAAYAKVGEQALGMKHTAMESLLGVTDAFSCGLSDGFQKVPTYMGSKWEYRTKADYDAGYFLGVEMSSFLNQQEALPKAPAKS